MKVDPGFLLCRFTRRLEWRDGENKRVIVMRPCLGERKFGLWLASFLGLSPYRIRLDEIGTLVWRQCDGQRTAGDIAEKLRTEFGEKVEPAEDRLYEFIVQLRRARMIEIHEGETPD